MAVPILQTSFASGELAKNLWGRTDIDKYRNGAAYMRNWFVDYRGGASTRPGTQYVGTCRAPQTQPPRLIKFEFSSDQTYALLLDGELGLRIITDGAFVTEAPLSITAGTNTGPLTLRVPGHTWGAGDDIFVSGVVGLVRPNGISGVNGRILQITAVSGNILTLADRIGGPVNASGYTAYTSGGTAARIYTVASLPWAAADLDGLVYAQSADVLSITSPTGNYPPYEIRRHGTTDWRVRPAVIGSTLSAPVSITATPLNNVIADPQLFYVYTVTSVDDTTREQSNSVATASAVNSALDQIKGVTNNITWDPVDGATSYNIYKSQVVPSGTENPAPYFWGLIGRSTSTAFQDVNFEPDYTTVPPTATNPFQDGAFTGVAILWAGAGYLAPVARIHDVTGAGAVVNVTANPAGQIITATVAAPGENYTSPNVKIVETNTTLGTGLTLAFDGTWVAAPSGSGFIPGPTSITITAGGTNYHTPDIALQVTGVPGSIDGEMFGLITSGVVTSLVPVVTPWAPSAGGGITFVAVDTLPGKGVPGTRAQVAVTLSGNNNPGVVCYFDQRRVFGGGPNDPDTFAMSQPGSYGNFDISFPTQASDSITGTIVSQEVNAIRSMTPMSSGLIVLTSTGAYQITGSGSSPYQQVPLTPTSVSSQAQAFSGASALAPLRVNYDLLYESARGFAIRDLSYNFYVNIYAGVDVSIAASHLFFNHSLKQWSWSEQPFYLVWAVRDDGALLSFTFLKEQNLYGWAHHDTFGTFQSVISLQEGNADAVYFIVNRFLNNAWHFLVERLAPRLLGGDPARNIPSTSEAAWCVDAGVEYPQAFPAGNLTLVQAGVTGALANPIIINTGMGYTLPTLTVYDRAGTGAGASLVATLTSGGITGVVIIAAGSNYQSPYIVIQDATGADAAIDIGVITTALFRCDQAVFSGLAGAVLRAAGGIGTITTVTDANNVICTMTTPVAGLLWNAQSPAITQPIPAGQWSLSFPAQVVGGLDHLNGTNVSIVADGSVPGEQPVVDGCVIMVQPASQITVGLGYTCQLETLRLESGEQPTIQGRRKHQAAVTLRQSDTRGLMIGRTWDTLVPVKEREGELFGEPIALEDGGGVLPSYLPGQPLTPKPWAARDRRVVLDPLWDTDGSLCILQAYPLPATMLAVIQETEVGDTPTP